MALYTRYTQTFLSDTMTLYNLMEKQFLSILIDDQFYQHWKLMSIKESVTKRQLLSIHIQHYPMKESFTY